MRAQTGDLGGARQLLAGLHGETAEQRATLEACVALAEGDLEATERWLVEHESSTADGALVRFTRATLRYRQGRLDEALVDVEAVEAELGDSPFLFKALRVAELRKSLERGLGEARGGVGTGDRGDLEADLGTDGGGAGADGDDRCAVVESGEVPGGAAAGEGDDLDLG